MSLDYDLMRLMGDVGAGAAGLGVGLGLVTLPWWFTRRRQPPAAFGGNEDFRELVENWRAASPAVANAWAALLDDDDGASCYCGGIGPTPDRIGHHNNCPEEEDRRQREAPRYYVRQMPGGGWHVVDRLAKLGVTVRAYARKWTAERGAARLNAK